MKKNCFLIKTCINVTKFKEFLIVCVLLLVNFSFVHAQSEKISISINNVTLKEFLSTVESKSKFTFVYRDAMLNGKSRVTLNVQNNSVKQILDQVLTPAKLTYTVEENSIYLSEQKTLETVTKKDISGHITDNFGGPLIGATVTEKGTKNSTLTNADGMYKLSVENDSQLEVSYIGFNSKSVDSQGKTTLDIQLEEDTRLLDEVVVVGYGIQKKVNLTGAITNIKSDELTAIPVANLSNTLAGRAPGMTVVGNSGMLGASSKITIRGGFGEPLFVIDGVIRNKAAFDALESYEIDQLSFLKDAATASVYGSTAGNGVVLVTTKKGDSNLTKPRFEYQGTYSFSKPTKKLMTDMFTATDELVYQNRAAEFQGLTVPNGEAEFEYFKDRDYNVNDWIWQTPWNTKHSLSVTGGGPNIQYYVLGGYLKEEGSYRNLTNEKFNLRSNLTTQLSKHIKMNINLSAFQTDDKRFFWPYTDDDNHDVYDLYRTTFNTPRTFPFYVNKDGTPASEMTDYPIYPAVGEWTSWNVVDAVIGDRYVKTRKRNMNAILSLEFDLGFITKGLTTRIQGNYVADDLSRKRFLTHQKNYMMQEADPNNRFIPGPLDENKYMVFNFGSTKEYMDYDLKNLWSEQVNWFVDYANTFGNHSVAATAVFEQASNGGERSKTTAMDPLTNYDQWFVFSTDIQNRRALAEEFTGGRLSWVGRFNYNYAQRYILEFSFRYDGNAKFAKNHRWGFFPSVSGAWRINQEKFMIPTQNWLSDLKLRLSYGTTGNDLNVENKAIGYFNYIPKYINGSTYIFGNSLQQGIKPGNTPTPYLTWATSKTFNGGIDFGFLNQRLNGAIDVFYKKETNILGARTISIPSSYGQVLAPENYAERSFRGGEFSLNWNDKVMAGEIDYTLYVNVGYAKDKWEYLDEEAMYKTGNVQHLSKVGLSDGRRTGFIADHIIRTQEEVDQLKAQGFKQWGRDPYVGGILYKDTHSDGREPGGDNKIDGNDAYNLLSDNTNPRINYGFGGDISYKGVSLSLHFQGVGNYDRFIGTAGTGGFPQYGGTTRPYFPLWAVGDTFHPTDNPDGKYPRVVGQQWYESGYGPTSFWKRSGAYLRLKNLNIGYDIPSKWLSSMGLTRAQVFMNATNLFYISDIGEFHDPEQETYDSYPLMKSFTFGINFSF